MTDIATLFAEISQRHAAACTHIDNGEEMDAKNEIIAAEEALIQIKDILRKPERPLSVHKFNPQPKPVKGSKR